MLGWLGIGAGELALMIPLVAVTGGVIVALRAVGSGGSKTDPEERAQETRLIQDMHSTLAKMEERIEALETLLFDRETGRSK